MAKYAPKFKTFILGRLQHCSIDTLRIIHGVSTTTIYRWKREQRLAQKIQRMKKSYGSLKGFPELPAHIKERIKNIDTPLHLGTGSTEMLKLRGRLHYYRTKCGLLQSLLDLETNKQGENNA